MRIDPNEAIRTMERSLGMIPGPVIVIALLAGPTILWLLYRFVVQPRTSRYAGGDGGMLWVCADCRSANDVRSSQCYRCGLERKEMDRLQVYDGEILVTLTEGEDDWEALPSAPMPVMPPGASPMMLRSPADASADPPPAGDLPPAGPLAPAPARPRRLVAVGPGRVRQKTAVAAEPVSSTGAANGQSNGKTAPKTAPGSTTKRSKRGGLAGAGDRAQNGAAVATVALADEALDPPTMEA